MAVKNKRAEYLLEFCAPHFKKVRRTFGNSGILAIRKGAFMPISHEGQIELLFGFVGVLLTVLVVVIFAGLFRRLKSEDERQKGVMPSPAGAHEVQETQASVRLEAHAPTATSVSGEAPEKDLKSALRQTEENIFGRIRSLFKPGQNSGHLEDIEEILYTSDLGPQTVQRLMGALEENLSRKEKADVEIVRTTLKKEMLDIFEGAQAGQPSPIELKAQPTVLMIVGVNGAGKTTSIGKISAQFASQGKKVLVAAGDTFRAAAGGQLKVWTERAQVEIFSPDGVTDPSAVAFDAVSRGKAQGYDVVIVDTAGRLHTQSNLMEELKKMKRVIAKVVPEAPHEILIVLDANSGQNALLQAKEFHQALQLSGVILTKMDGTAKGGVALGVSQELKIPIKLIGIGEGIKDLKPFSSREFVESILPG